MGIEWMLILRVGDRVIEPPARRVIRTLRSMTEGRQSAYDSGLRNIWEEVCAQVQGNLSVMWDAYLEVIDSIALAEAKKMPRLDQEIAWLLCDDGTDWSCSDEAELARHVPVVIDQVAEVIRNRVLEVAGEWSNPAIRGYLEWSSRLD